MRHFIDLFRRSPGRHTHRAVAARLALDQLHAEALAYHQALTDAGAFGEPDTFGYSDDPDAFALAEMFELSEADTVPLVGEDTIVIDRQQVLAALAAG